MGLKNDNFTHILFSCLFLWALLSIADANNPKIGAENGSQNRGNPNTNGTLCGTEKTQSPINIVDDEVVVWPSLGDLNTTYKPTPAIIRNKRHAIYVDWKGDAGGITINDTEYKLQQSHWHTPSEHTINGVRFNMEQHLVHRNSQGDFVVVTILYDLGPPDSFFARLEPYLQSAKYEGIDLGVVDPSNIKFEGREYYRYNDTLITPLCSGNVTSRVFWTILKTAGTVSINQVKALRDAIHDGNIGNAVPIQPLNGRTVYLFRPRDSI